MSELDRYRTVLGSCSNPDGMYLELWDCESDRLALWAFYSDADGSIEFTEYQPDVAGPVKQWFQQEAHQRLRPTEA